MTNRVTVGRVVRRVLRPIIARLGLDRPEIEHLLRQQDELGARVEQVVRAQERVEAYFDRFREEIRAEFGDLVEIAAGSRAVLAELSPPDGPDGAGIALQRRFDHSLLHAEAEALASRQQFQRELAEVRSTTRLTQALVERALAAPSRTTALVETTGETTDGTAGASTAVQLSGPTPEPAGPSAPVFDHDVPGFDLLYRSFEDRHRGEATSIRDRQSDDYLELLSGLPHPELPIADLGCGRGELVQLLDAAGNPALGVDSNLSQVVDGNSELFWEDDLFRWLDAQSDASHRAIVSMHVVEHLPLDLQIRLIFEARRVLAEGGVLILETPNTLSLSVAASNFWVDPTHQRPVHPLFLEFLAAEAGFAATEIRPLHPIPASFRGGDVVPELVEDLDSLILGAGDYALLAWR